LRAFRGYEVQALHALLHAGRDVPAARARMCVLSQEGALAPAASLLPARLDSPAREVLLRSLRTHGENWRAAAAALRDAEEGAVDVSVARLQDCYYGQMAAEHRRDCDRALRQYEHKRRMATAKARKDSKRKAGAAAGSGDDGDGMEGKSSGGDGSSSSGAARGGAEAVEDAAEASDGERPVQAVPSLWMQAETDVEDDEEDEVDDDEGTDGTEADEVVARGDVDGDADASTEVDIGAPMAPPVDAQ